MAYLPTIILYILIFGVIYFVMIRPNIKQQRAHQAMLDSLKKGDMIITTGGIIGKILEIKNDQLLIDTSSTKVLISRTYVSNIYSTEKKSQDRAQKK